MTEDPASSSACQRQALTRATSKQFPALYLLAQLALDVGDQVRALTIDLVLRVEERAAPVIALGLLTISYRAIVGEFGTSTYMEKWPNRLMMGFDPRES